MALKSFGAKKRGSDALDSTTTTEQAAAQKKNERVPMTVRLDKAQWRRIKELALDEGTSVQDLAVRGLSRLLEEKGLDPL
jgi:hypothetical protein